MTRLEDELRDLFDRAATGVGTSRATDDALDDVVGRAGARAARTRRVAAMTTAALAVVMLAATVVATSRNGDDRASELRVGDDSPATTTTTTSVLALPSISIPPTSTPTATVPPVTVTVPRRVVTTPRPTVPPTTLPTPAAGGGCGATNRAIDVAAVWPDGGLVATLSGGDIAASDDLGATWRFHCGVLHGDGGATVAGLETVEAGVAWARFVARGAERPFARSVDRGRSWTLMNGPVPGMQVYGTSFVSATTLWAWGVNGQTPALYRTTDGTSWEPVALPNGEAVGDAVFLDGTSGWAATRSGGVRVFSTVDGGASWQPGNAPAGLANVLDIDAHDADHVHLTVTLPDGRGAMVSTADGGDTWKVAETAGTVPVSVAAIDDRAAVAVTQSSSVWHTLDGGDTWTAVDNLAEGPYSPRFVGSAGGRYAVVPSGQMLAVSDDDSRTWRRAIVR